MTVVAVGVAGTAGWRDTWWKDGSPLWAHLATLGITPARVGGRPFRWSTDLGWTWQFWRSWFGQMRHSDWEAGGDSLASYLEHLPFEDRNVIAHSHGGQVALYCAALGVPIHRLLTIGTPVREDMGDVIAAARPHIDKWHHVYDPRWDLWARLGMVGDGRLGGCRMFPPADANLAVRRVGHGGLLMKPARFALWQEVGLADFLRSR
jgi:pimeloyl-ACP methyl ester carboxylesterase